MAKILVVDDMESHRNELKNILGGQYTLLESDRSLDGLKKASQHDDIKLFILDYHMPDLNGIQLAKKIRELPAYVKSHIIIYTTETSDALVQEGKSLGHLIWMLKPMNAGNFELTVKKLIQRAG